MSKMALSMLCLFFTSLMIGCSYSIKLDLHGFYQSNMVNGYHVQMLFNKEDNNFY
ncbi:hypothetical protein [Faecalimicrobium sp. JNUCC 81]